MTNRLHIAVLATRIGKKVLLYDCSYGKVYDIAKWSILPNCSTCTLMEKQRTAIAKSASHSISIELLETEVSGRTVSFHAKCSKPGWVKEDLVLEYSEEVPSLENVPIAVLNAAFVLSVMPIALCEEVHLYAS